MGNDEEQIYWEGEWQKGLCASWCGEHCCMAFWCPCMLVNKTHEMLENKDEKTPSGCGWIGCAWCLFNGCGVGWVISCLQRGKIRGNNIDGNGCTDCLASAFCPCCAIPQQLLELEKSRDYPHKTRKVDTNGYQRQAGMHR